MGFLRSCSSMLKRKFVLKLLFLMGSSLLIFYFISGGAENDDTQEDTKQRRNDLRHMLNAYEDNLDSLRAPTTSVPRHAVREEKNSDRGAPPVPAEYVRVEQYGQSGVRRHKSLNDSGRDNNRPDDNYRQKDNYRREDNRREDNRHSDLDRNGNQVFDHQKSSATRPSASTSTPRSTPHVSRKHSADYYADYERMVREKSHKSMKARVKEKQWETYDYENPSNLLQIHVDRAPEHHDGIGQPWPMPQSYITEQTTFPVDVDNFIIEQPRQSCGRVVRAISRYTRHINSKVDLFIPDGDKLLKVDGQSRVLRQLKVLLSRPCNDGDLPHEHMSEQYKLTINEEEVVLSAQEPWGVIRGLETFSQIIYYSRGYARVNATYIKDYPRFEFRGLMLDTARHYIPIKYLKRTLDAMSYNKLNVFHWHIVDDQSFPFVSKAFPKLSKEGAYSQSQVYTHTDIADLIDYAADRAIRIVPEFDSPGHTRSWGLGYPHLLTNCSVEHHPFGAVNPISEYTYQFMAKLWEEIRGLFPDSTVHVGGDEINYKCWLRLRKIRDFMLEHNMTIDQYDFMSLDGDKLQGYYLKHLIDVMPKDRKKIAWEEAFHAAQIWNVSTDELIINVWKGGDYEWQYTMENVVRHGYKAILSAPWYLNYISYGRDWTKYYEQDPHSFSMYSEGSQSSKENVIGGQVCMWAEFIDESNLEPTLWPRANAPAEKLWSAATMNDWRMAEARFENHRCRMTRRGIRAHPNSGPGSCRGNMKIKPPYDAYQPYT